MVQRPVIIAAAALLMLGGSGVASAQIAPPPDLNVFVARHLAIRPDVEATIVRRNAQNYVVTAVSVHMAYHFEDHPITPSRSR
jgi:hypothetical protein